MEGNGISLHNGIVMPSMAVGTNWMDRSELSRIMRSAFRCGFRAIDTARDYGNEPVVGSALKSVLKDVGLSREDVFVTTKIGNRQQIGGDVEHEIGISLKNLRTDYLDLWLMHWPFPGFYEKTWEKMVKVYESGKVRAIGVANFDVRHIKRLSELFPEMKPAVNQMEYHPLRTVPELMHLLGENDIRVQAYAPLCRMVPALKDSQLLDAIARKYGKSIGQVILRWHVQQGVMPVFKTENEERFKENSDIYDFELTDSEMLAVASLNQDYKYHIESVNCPGY